MLEQQRMGEKQRKRNKQQNHVTDSRFSQWMKNNLVQMLNQLETAAGNAMGMPYENRLYDEQLETAGKWNSGKTCAAVGNNLDEDLQLMWVGTSVDKHSCVKRLDSL